ncbi:MAG: hypothetical protein NUV82_03660, partial [Candidatus Komeilibacteria bacterium]|nr:hypothetical protein [Candidatus Komeilibacteria bacterium]
SSLEWRKAMDDLKKSWPNFSPSDYSAKILTWVEFPYLAESAVEEKIKNNPVAAREQIEKLLLELQSLLIDAEYLKEMVTGQIADYTSTGDKKMDSEIESEMKKHWHYIAKMAANAEELRQLLENKMKDLV